jgi:hypothetical protein
LFAVPGDGPALVREGKGDAAPAGEEALDFHKGYQGSQFAVLYEGEIKRFVLI